MRVPFFMSLFYWMLITLERKIYQKSLALHKGLSLANIIHRDKT